VRRSAAPEPCRLHFPLLLCCTVFTKLTVLTVLTVCLRPGLGQFISIWSSYAGLGSISQIKRDVVVPLGRIMSGITKDGTVGHHL
jgi:hypothetical protein